MDRFANWGCTSEYLIHSTLETDLIFCYNFIEHPNEGSTRSYLELF